MIFSVRSSSFCRALYSQPSTINQLRPPCTRSRQLTFTQRSTLRSSSSKLTQLHNHAPKNYFSTDIPNNTKIMEVVVQCSDGVQLAAKEFSSSSKHDHFKLIKDKTKILCLHGWLDNAASFNLLAPELTTRMYADVIALDFPGHGHSSHKSSDGPTQILSEYALYVAEALTSLNWIQPLDKSIASRKKKKSDLNSNFNNKNSEDDSEQGSKITIIGHSMGAGVALVFAAAYPEYVDRLILLEGAGPLARKGTDASRHVRQAIERRMTSNKLLYPEFANIEGNIQNPNVKEKSEKFGSDLSRGKRRYANIQAAVNARMKTATLTPGNQYISTEAATALVCRATYPADEVIGSKTAGGIELDPSTYGGPVHFRHDSRLMWPSFHYYTQEQVHALMDDVRCPTCLLLANEGWPLDRASFDQSLQILQPAMFQQLPGSHHFHADPIDAPAVSDAIIDFLKQEIKVFR